MQCETTFPKLENPINVVDTFSVVGFSQLEDSLQTSNLNSGNWLLGSFNDPVFGISASTMYTQFRLPSSNVDFGDGATIDSVVMYLSYAGAYGSWDRFKGFWFFLFLIIATPKSISHVIISKLISFLNTTIDFQTSPFQDPLYLGTA